MTKKISSIQAFSLSRKYQTRLDKLQTKLQKNRSQIIRDAIDQLDKSGKNTGIASAESSSETNSCLPNQILKNYYELISLQDSRPTITIGVAILHRYHKVLIGHRKNRDPHLKNLSWTFPSGQFSSLDFTKEVSATVFRETHLKCRVLKLIHARMIPDSPAKKVRIVALYYHCQITSGTPAPGGDFRSLKWVTATDVTNYFTTSVCDEIMTFLGTL